MNDLLGGQVDIMCDQTTNTTQQIEGGKIKAFAVTTPKRLTIPSLAKLPTLDESGLKGFNVTIWHGLYAPKGTPKAALDKINAALRGALKDPEFIKREEALGAVVVTDGRVGQAEHKKFVESEIAKWGPVIKAAGQYADGAGVKRDLQGWLRRPMSWHEDSLRDWLAQVRSGRLSRRRFIGPPSASARRPMALRLLAHGALAHAQVPLPTPPRGAAAARCASSWQGATILNSHFSAGSRTSSRRLFCGHWPIRRRWLADRCSLPRSKRPWHLRATACR
jgi:hypothetical protein